MEWEAPSTQFLTLRASPELRLQQELMSTAFSGCSL
jgi:hypothetical protein